MRRRNRGLLASILLLGAMLVLAALAFGYQSYLGEKKEQKKEKKPVKTVEILKTPDIEEAGLSEDLSVYSEDDPDSVVYFYVTVQKGDPGSDTDHTFDQVNNTVRFIDNSHAAIDVYARAIVQVGDENGPQMGMLGYGVEKANASIRIRGNSSSTMSQKSYKLKLDDEAGLWRGQRNIALNKSIFDVTRFRNKLYFDLLKDVEHVPSIRTQFVRLFIKDETSGKTAFEDYGFYTQAEVPGKKYLANHGLDRDGYLYKAISFNFEMEPGLKNFDDPGFNQKAFDQILSCKGREDNQKIIRLVEMINDTSMDINEIIGTYIDRDNYISWLAYNILTANIDTMEQNFYLYSPLNSEKWYFIPWDGDNMLPFEEYRMEGSLGDYGEHLKGITNYWGVILHQRFLKYRENREELAKRVDELHQFINEETVSALAARYNETVTPYVSQMPDLYYLGHTLAERQQIVKGFGREIETAYQNFYETLEALMPFFLQDPLQEEEEITILWDEAYDFENEKVQYHLLVSQYPDMRAPVIEETLDETMFFTSTEVLKPGTWYWTVTAENESKKTSSPMNKTQVGDKWYPGVECMEVME